MSSTRPLIRFIAPDAPGEFDSGGRQRIGHTLRGVLRVADVDVVLLSKPSTADAALRAMAGVRSVEHAPATKRSLSVPGRIRALLARGRPYSRASRIHVDRSGTLADGSGYDATWHSSLWAWLAAPKADGERSVVDLYDLQDVLVERRVAAAGSRSIGANLSLRSAGRRIWRRREITQLRQAQHEVLRRSDLVLVASDHDRQRLGDAAKVIPNGAALPREVDADSLGVDRSGACRGLFVGYMSWEPNRDAARFFATEILPRVRSRRPNYTFRAVGERFNQLDELANQEGVELPGYVPDLGAEYRAASVVVVPLRVGSGTRIKILEAFAHGVPVVSTRIGAEGLPVESGEHLLLADSAEEFAAAVDRLEGDLELRASLREAALDLVKESYDWARIEELVAEEVRVLLDRR